MKGASVMPSTDSRSRYLVLALASRSLIKSLLVYVDEGHADAQLEASLNDVTESLRASKDVNRLFGPIPTESPFRNYEQVMILEEAEEALNVGDIGDKLSHALRNSPDRETRRRSVEDAVEFFYALENRALHHYNREMGARDI
jgi:hypothetical protein